MNIIIRSTEIRDRYNYYTVDYFIISNMVTKNGYRLFNINSKKL
jgi:hypothetical protein